MFDFSKGVFVQLDGIIYQAIKQPHISEYLFYNIKTGSMWRIESLKNNRTKEEIKSYFFSHPVKIFYGTLKVEEKFEKLSYLVAGDKFQLKCTGADLSIYTLLRPTPEAKRELGFVYSDTDNRLWHSSIDLDVQKV